VQRRGRILRTFTNKKFAKIYDVIVLPSSDMKKWAEIELRRFREYARLAVNWDELEIQLEDLLEEYSLSTDDINVFEYEDMEDYGDE